MNSWPRSLRTLWSPPSRWETIESHERQKNFSSQISWRVFFFPTRMQRGLFFLFSFFLLDTKPEGPYRYSPTRNPEARNHHDTWPPSFFFFFYETSDKRLRAKFPGSFVTVPWQRSDFRSFFRSHIPLPLSRPMPHRIPLFERWIEFDVFFLSRRKRYMYM